MQSEPLLITYKDEKGLSNALASLSDGLKNVIPHRKNRSSSLASNIYQNIGPGNISIRDRFVRQDYDQYRPEESVPSDPVGKIDASIAAYENHSMVKNIVDLMSDFVVQGIDVVAKTKEAEKIYKYWFHKIVSGPTFSERFVNCIIKGGMTPVKKATGQLTQGQVDKYRKALGADINYQEDPTPKKREIPVRYTILHPTSLDPIAPELSVFLDDKSLRYGLKIPYDLQKTILNPKDSLEKELVDKLPKYLVDFVKQNSIAKKDRAFPIPSDKLSVYFYKKDDWQLWPVPMLAPVLTDLKLLEKMKLADQSALDGAISQIRIWKLGDLEHKILPQQSGIQRFAEIITNAVGGGVVDIVWGPAVELIESSTNLHQFLGEGKYIAVLNAIRVGLGVPSILVGAGKTSAGFTNNFIELKTFQERLQYIRNILIQFWEHEFSLVQKALGLKRPAILVFDRNTLTDEAAQVQLLINMIDRDILSDEFLQERVGAIPEVEMARKSREMKARSRGAKPPKASPFHNPQHREKIEQALIQQGALDPKEIGLDYKIDKSVFKPKGQPGQGRPISSKDKQKRKQKRVTPRTSASRVEFIRALSWAEDIQKEIASLVNSSYLSSLGKTSMRQLTDEEYRVIEDYKFAILCNLKTGTKFTEDLYHDLLRRDIDISTLHSTLLNAAIAEYTKSNGTAPSIDKVRNFKSTVVALVNAADYSDNYI